MKGEIEGIIIKGIGGFYYVEVKNDLGKLESKIDCNSDNCSFEFGAKKDICKIKNGIVYECKARGLFRNSKEKPYVGDSVIIKLHEDGFPSIEKILPRKNKLLRPPIANIDQLAIVVSTVEPNPNTFVIDQMIVIAELSDITPIVVISKTDLDDSEKICDIYQSAGFEVITMSSTSDDDLDKLKQILKGKITAFAGNSGVGKSTLLNRIKPGLNLTSGEISEKLGRGRHTTRQVEFFEFNEGYIVDTPGFSSIDLLKNSDINKQDLAAGFREFIPWLGNCKFNTCSHTCEKGCAILENLKLGNIQQSRYDSYLQIYNSIKDVRDWQKIKK